MLYSSLPAAFVVGLAAFSFWNYRRSQAQIANMTPEEKALGFHNYYAGYYELLANERIIGVWTGEVWSAPMGATRAVAGGVLNALSKEVIGVSVYTPRVIVAATSLHRVVVAEEYSDDMKRGYYKQVAAFEPGVRIESSPPGANIGMPPQNPTNRAERLEFVLLRGVSGEMPLWLAKGSVANRSDSASIFSLIG